MTLAWIAIGVVFLCFAVVILFGAPYLPTLKRQQKKALAAMNLKPGQTVYDLGCGDGRLLVTAAKSGLKAVGYEINPLLAAFCWARSLRYPGKIKVVWGNFWKADISSADGVYVFLLDGYMARLDKYLDKQFISKKVTVVSYGFKVPGKKPVSSHDGLFIYSYGVVAHR